MPPRMFVLLSLSLAAASAAAASFDCTRATTLVELAICADRELSSLDERMASAYRKALSKPGADSTRLKIGQQYWLDGERARCADADCLKHVYENHIRDLAEPDAPMRLYGPPEDNWNVTGTFRSRPAEIRIHQIAPGRVRFGISASSGMHMGLLIDEASFYRGIALYDTPDCRLALDFTTAGSVHVMQAGPCDMGFGVSAAGSHRRIDRRVPTFDDLE